jgi:hypothetical protein
MSTLGPTREVSIAIGPSVNALEWIASEEGRGKAGLNDLAKLKRFPSPLKGGMDWEGEDPGGPQGRKPAGSIRRTWLPRAVNSRP